VVDDMANDPVADLARAEFIERMPESVMQLQLPTNHLGSIAPRYAAAIGGGYRSHWATAFPTALDPSSDRRTAGGYPLWKAAWRQ
jgi:hypothetical protein